MLVISDPSSQNSRDLKPPITRVTEDKKNQKITRVTDGLKTLDWIKKNKCFEASHHPNFKTTRSTTKGPYYKQINR
jgi:hypothetical protein